MNVFILNDGCVREDALTQNLRERLKKESWSSLKLIRYLIYYKII